MTLHDSVNFPAGPVNGYVGIFSKKEPWEVGKENEIVTDVWGSGLKPRYKADTMLLSKEHTNDSAYCVESGKLFWKMHGTDTKTSDDMYVLIEMTSTLLASNITSETLFMLGRPASFDLTLTTGADSTFPTYTDHKCGSYSDSAGD